MAENNTYEPENDTNLAADLTSSDVYTPENDLDLQQGLTSTPTLQTQAAQAIATGDTLNLAGTTTLDTVSADATGSGITDLFITTGLFTLRKATANASGNATSISGSSTLDTVTADASAIGGASNLQDLNLDTATSNASGTGGTGLKLERPPLPVTEASASATGGETSFNVPGTGGEITVLIDGERIDTYTNIEIQKRLNEVDTFSFQAFIEDSSDRALIQEGAEVKIIESYQDLLFKGVLNEVEYKSNFRAKCEGNGMVQKLLDRKTDRDTYTNSAGDDIVKAEVQETVMDYGAIESAPQVSVRFDHDNLARAVAGVANATAYDWYIDQDFDDQFETDYLNFVRDAGRDMVQQTFAIGEDAQMVDRNKDEGFVANDITLLGRGDGVNQLEANVFAASTKYTDTTEIITESETGSFTVEDATQLGSVGDNLLIRAGIEVMDVDITDSSTLSINSRAQPDWESNDTPQIRHYEGVRVWTVENVTQGLGRFAPESRDTAEDGSSIDTFGVKEQRETDKTIVDLSTLEKAADIDLKNRFEDVFRVQIEPTDPRVTRDLQLGDAVDVEDLTAMDVDDTFEVVGMDVKRNSAEEGTTLHLANRPRRLTERLSEMESNTDTLNAHMQGATNFNSERFEDNANQLYPLDTEVYIPEDVVKVNKMEINLSREKFRGYTKGVSTNYGENSTDNAGLLSFDNNTGNSINGSLNVPGIGTKNVNKLRALAMIKIIDIDGTNTADIRTTVTNTTTGETIIDEETGYYDKSSTVFEGVISTDDGNLTGDNISFEAEITDDKGNTIDAEIRIVLVSESAHSHDDQYGLFEPASEETLDVNVLVDGERVETVENLGVGDKVDQPIDISNSLSDPIPGEYHSIKLKPFDDTAYTVKNLDFIESTASDLGDARAWNDDGSKLYVAEPNNGAITSYEVAVPYDVGAVLTQVHTEDVSSNTPEPEMMEFAMNGDYLFVMDGDSEEVDRYSLSTPYDLSTASYDHSSTSLSFSALGEEFAVEKDGKKLYYLDSNNNEVDEYTFNTAYDLTSLQFESSDSVLADQANSLEFAEDGSKYFILDTDENAVEEYELSTPYDLSTSTYIDQKNLEQLPDFPPAQFMRFVKEGTELQINGSSDTYVYSTGGSKGRCRLSANLVQKVFIESTL